MFPCGEAGGQRAVPGRAHGTAGAGPEELPGTGSESCPGVALVGHQWPAVNAIGTGRSCLARHCCQELQRFRCLWFQGLREIHLSPSFLSPPLSLPAWRKNTSVIYNSVTGPLPHPSSPGRSQGIWERGRSCARTGFSSRQQSLGAVSQLGAPSPAISG